MNRAELEKKVGQFTRSIVYEKGFVSSIDVLMRLELLTREDYESWRFGRVPFLEKVCKANLAQLTFINRTIRKTAASLDFEESFTVYRKFGKGPKPGLIFSKSREPQIEALYATHYVDKARIKEIKGAKTVDAQNFKDPAV